MEMITKKLMEKNGQGGHNPVANNNNNEKAGISLGEANQQNNGDNGCCNMSL